MYKKTFLSSQIDANGSGGIIWFLGWSVLFTIIFGYVKIDIATEPFFLFYAANMFHGWFWILATIFLFGVKWSFVYAQFAFGISYWLFAIFSFLVLRVARPAFFVHISIFFVGTFLFFFLYSLFGHVSLDLFAILREASFSVLIFVPLYKIFFKHLV